MIFIIQEKIIKSIKFFSQFENHYSGSWFDKECILVMDIFYLSSSDIPELVSEGKITVAVYGLGKMGQPLAVIFASAGAKVIGVDVDERVVSMINEGRTALLGEPGVREGIERFVREGKLWATTDMVKAAQLADFIVVIVPVMVDEENKDPDLNALLTVSEAIGKGLKKGSVVIIESTVPPSTTNEFVCPIIEKSSNLKAGRDFGLVYSPERTYVGRVIEDVTKRYPKIVGGINEQSTEVASAFYATFCERGVIKMNSAETAEVTKVFEGIYRDVNIALANELARFCEKTRIDYFEVKKAANSQPFCHLHDPGVGVGGHCIPVYPHFVIKIAESIGLKLEVTKTARKVNEEAPLHVINLVEKGLAKISKEIKGANVVILGLSYRGGVKESRFSPTFDLVKELAKKEALVTVNDVLWSAEEGKMFPFKFEPNIMKAVDGADCIIIATDHSEYKELDLEKIVNQVAKKPLVIVDGRQVFEPKLFSKFKDVIYMAVGKPNA